MPNGFPYTKIEWVNLTTVPGQSDPVQGNTISLTDYTQPATGSYITTLKGIQGFDAAPTQLFFDELSGNDGGNYRGSRVPTREIFIPIVFGSADRAVMNNLKRDLLSRLNPARGVGRIVVTEGDGSTRYIDCLYEGGAEGDFGADSHGFLHQKYGLKFRAIDPYWYSATKIQVPFGALVGGLKPFFGTPFFGLGINASAGLNQAVPLTLSGDVETWPTWTIQGPVDAVTFGLSGTTTASWKLNFPLTTGQTAYVDTRPKMRKILFLTAPPALTGVNNWDKLQTGDDFWPLAPLGNNTVTISAGAIGATTTVTMNYRPRFYSA